MKKRRILIEANFRKLKENLTKVLLECPRCGCEFDIEADSEKNMAWIQEKSAFVAQCPLCATVQKC